jgi:hypothetical protein
LDEALRSLSAQIIPYKDISHEALIKRDLDRINPFRKVGSNKDSAGYRDALIWESILRNVVPNSDKVIFISANKSDFYGKGSDELHSLLKKDLENLGFKPDHVLVCMNLKAFVDKYVKPLLPEVSTSDGSSLVQYFVNNKDKIKNRLLEYFIKNKGEVSRQLESKLGLPFDLSWSETDMLTIREIGDFEDFSVLQAYGIDDEFINVKFDFQTYFELEFYVHNYSPDYDSELPSYVDVEEYDEDKYGAWLRVTADLPMEGSLTLNIIDNSVQDVEGSFIEIFGFCPKCREPITHDAAETCYKCHYDFF